MWTPRRCSMAEYRESCLRIFEKHLDRPPETEDLASHAYTRVTSSAYRST